MGWDTTKQVVKGMTGISRLERRLENSYEESLYLRGRVKELESYQLGAVGPNDHLNLRNHHYYRGRARALDRSNDLARGAIDTLVSSIIGGGLMPQPMFMDMSGNVLDTLNDEVSALWDEWSFRPESTGSLDEFSSQFLQAITWVRDGEIFVHHLRGNVEDFMHESDIAYSYESIEGDRIGNQFSTPGELVTTQGTLDLDGIEVDSFGKAVSFTILGNARSYPIGRSKRRHVPADRMTHAKHIRRVNTFRGVTMLEPVLDTFEAIRDIDSAELTAVKMASRMTAAIKTEEGSTSWRGSDDDNPGRERNRVDLPEGSVWHDLKPGESVEVIKNERPNNSLIAFRASQIRKIAAGMGFQYSTLARDYEGSYSAARQELVEAQRFYRRHFNYWVNTIEREKWKHFIDALDMRGMVDFSMVDKKTLYDPLYIPPSLPWIDPLKEANAFEKLVGNGFESRSQVIRMRGRRIRDVDAERGRDSFKKEEK